MASESPLFQSSMELLAHAVTHFVAGTEQDRKLLILHLANAIELILKDLVLDSGKSIYRSPKETINIYKSINILKGAQVSVPFLNKVELLIDERNTLQHRFGSPNELTAIFYMNICTDFFSEILRDHYDLLFDEVLDQFGVPSDVAAFRIRAPSDDSKLESLKQLANVHPLGALLSATTYLEKLNRDFLEQLRLEYDFRRRPFYSSMFHRFLYSHGIEIERDLIRSMDELRHMRNLAAHGCEDPTKEQVESCISTIEKYEVFLQELDLKQTRQTIMSSIEEQRRKAQQEDRRASSENAQNAPSKEPSS